jgi:hypothetical protein
LLQNISPYTQESMKKSPSSEQKTRKICVCVTFEILFAYLKARNIRSQIPNLCPVVQLRNIITIITHTWGKKCREISRDTNCRNKKRS